jgi:peptidoglycan-associated lipoprotein
MIRSALFRSLRNFPLILICAMLGACATTQRSSSGSGDQTPAPISEASPQTAAQPGDLPGTAGASSGTAGARQGSSEAGAPGAGDAAQLKRQLADQDAQINRLRNDQQAGAEREEIETRQLREQQAAAAAGARELEPSSGAASATQSKPQDEMAAFPANGNAAESGGADGRGSAAATLERSVYFDYDQASVADKYDAMLTATAAYLKARPNVETEVHGHCDERGSREYNLALGARRAQAVKRALELGGADGSHISVISYGAEKPVALGKDEESYSQNRRVDIVY